MDKSKAILIILLAIVLVVGFVAFKFYSDNQKLTTEHEDLKADKARLESKHRDLTNEHARVKSEKVSLEETAKKIEAELSRLEDQNRQLQIKFDSVSQERDILAERLMAKPRAEMVGGPTTTAPASEEYWMDFIRKKADLEAKLDELSNDLSDTKNKLAETDKKNKELSIKIDELSKEKQTLEREIIFKERAMSIMSKDLVSEREARRKIASDLDKMRSDNVGLKRELILANKEKMQLQNDLKQIASSKEVLDQKISDIRNILKEKSMALEQLEEQLDKAMTGGRVAAKDTASVELPPIVVKPGVSGVKGLTGEVVAVNQAENFIIIDIGDSSGVRPGLKFRVVRGGKEIGLVEVIETRRDISAADVKEVFGGFALQEGDKVVSQ